MSLTAAVLPGYDSDRLALIGLVVLAVSLILLPLWVGTSRRLVPVSQVHRGRWTPLDLAAVVFAGVSALLLAPLLLEAGIGRSIEGAPGEELQLFELFGSGVRVPLVGVQLLLQLVIFLAPAAVIAGRAATLEPRGWRALGIRPGGNRRACALGALGFALFLPAFLSLSWVWHWLLEALGEPVEAQEVAQQAVLIGGAWLPLLLVLVVVILPFFEELVFRGFLQPLLVDRLGGAGGVVVTSLAFALLHEQTARLPVFALSLFLGSVMLRTARLPAVWLIHSLNNGIAIALVLHPTTRELMLET